MNDLAVEIVGAGTDSPVVEILTPGFGFGATPAQLLADADFPAALVALGLPGLTDAVLRLLVARIAALTPVTLALAPARRQLRRGGLLTRSGLKPGTPSGV